MSCRCPDDDGCWSPGIITMTDEAIAAVEFEPLGGLEREILLGSDVPDFVAMASEDRAVAEAATRRHLRAVFPRPCPKCGLHPDHHSPTCRRVR